ncbi:hypothetical protein [Saccharothrix syringae]|uniref:Uncharacterized protein n=1 Tax=Saccharothrix syringae TaxID=103733 RepID=A0A5Q0H0U2_SACSY|nr:hypothetical protein [Saccharothrix syringae]QFZ19723.1 hypothetical protein EKG83_21845 [Saccharothrix syringae]
MTAIPHQHDPAALLLICDSCGSAYEGDTCLPWITLWAVAIGAGWRGRDRAIGPHRCARCPA